MQISAMRWSELHGDMQSGYFQIPPLTYEAQQLERS